MGNSKSYPLSKSKQRCCSLHSIRYRCFKKKS